jgi:hypothetical protein
MECPSGFNMAARLFPGYQQAWRPFMLALQACVARPALMGKMWRRGEMRLGVAYAEIQKAKQASAQSTSLLRHSGVHKQSDPRLRPVGRTARRCVSYAVTAPYHQKRMLTSTV